MDSIFRPLRRARRTCCRAPAESQIPSLGPLVACNVGIGCDIKTSTCVQPCGGTGQVCCDGPETRAPKWTADGKVYSPNTWDMQEMCNAGACERQTHRCFACGTVDGQPCCPPDAAQATARCIGERLSCEFDPQKPFFAGGTCIKCGIRGRPPCDWGCDPGLDMLKGLCEICGADGQVPCDKGCKPGLGMKGGSVAPVAVSTRFRAIPAAIRGWESGKACALRAVVPARHHATRAATPGCGRSTTCARRAVG